MADHITIAPISGPVTVTAGDVLLGQSHKALELREGGYDPVVYVPRGDVDMGTLEKTAKVTRCPHKGSASYYSIRTTAGLLENAVWSYESPLPAMATIAGHLAFYPDRVEVRRG